MIARRELIYARRRSPSYELEIVLNGVKPRIWRRLRVPGAAKLGWLHAVLQVAMGWTNSHLHQFRVGEALYSDTRDHFAEFESDPEILDENKFTLEKIAPCERATLLYDYDFGDSWEHLITIGKIFPPEGAVEQKAVCTGGARACPPEDCGGIWGYANLLQALKNRKHPDHRPLKEWLGGPFDAEAFDAENTNLWLGHLTWPRVTEARLRKVLMARDYYQE